MKIKTSSLIGPALDWAGCSGGTMRYDWLIFWVSLILFLVITGE